MMRLFTYHFLLMKLTPASFIKQLLNIHELSWVEWIDYIDAMITKKLKNISTSQVVFYY